MYTRSSPDWYDALGKLTAVQLEVVLVPISVLASVKKVTKVLTTTFPVTFNELDTFAVPVITTFPLKLPVFAEITNLLVELPNNIVLDVGTRAVTFATNPVVVKLEEFITPL